MATVTKTWSFPADAQGLTRGSGSASISFAWVSADQSVQFSTTSRNFTGTTRAVGPATGETWETWGVPAGSTVTGVRVAGWKYRLAANTGLTSADLSIQVSNDSLTPLTVASPLDASLPVTPTATTYTAGAAGSLQAVNSFYTASDTTVQLLLVYTESTGSTQSPNVQYRFDDIAIEITYTPPAGGGTPAAMSPAAMLMGM